MVNMKNKISLLTLIVISLFLPVLTGAQKYEKPDIRIETELRKSGYVGEVFEYSVRILSTTPDLSDIRVSQSPVFPQGVKVIKGVVRNSRPEEVKVKGKTYYRILVRRDFLIPSHPGKFVIGDSRYVVLIPYVSDYYDDFFWGRRQVVQYDEIAVECKGTDFKASVLPSQGKTDFTGCVGEFNIEGWFPPGKISVGQEAYAVFSISGFGSLQDLELPNLYKMFGEGCQLRQIEQSEEQSQREGRLFSEVTLTCRFMPESEDFVINPLCLTFFSPESRQYVRKCSDALHFTGHPQGKKSSTSKDAIAI